MTIDVEFWGCYLKILQLFESLVPHLKKVRSTSVLQSSDLFDFAIFLILLYSKVNIAKSKKSELWNHLSYRGLPYLFEVRSQTFRNNCKISRSQPQNSTSIVILTQPPWKAKVRNLKKCHGIIPFRPKLVNKWDHVILFKFYFFKSMALKSIRV
jgi:hypothetical protein